MSTIKIYFSDTPIGNEEPNGTNSFNWKNDNSSRAPYSLTFKLIEGSSIVEKFIENIKKKCHQSESGDSCFLRWNSYKEERLNSDDYAALVKELNYNVESAIAVFDSDMFTENFIVKENDTDEEIIQKLNAIHFSFENLAIQPEVKNDIDKFELCERLNFLVHQLEPFFKIQKNTRRFYVSRISAISEIETKPFPLLEDEDYKCFEWNEDGNLYLDFYTVGKDLHAASQTNDLDLVKNREVKQQTLISPAFNFTLKPDKFKNTEQSIQDYNEQKQIHYDWCKKNNVDQYYDYTLPKYNIGRAKLGDLVETDYEDIVKNLNKYAHIVGVYYSDE